MANVSVYKIEGKEVGSIELNDAVFGVEVNEHLVHMAVVNQLANNRQGTNFFAFNIVNRYVCHLCGPPSLEKLLSSFYCFFQCY